MQDKIENWIENLNSLWFELGRIKAELSQRKDYEMLEILDTIELCIDEEAILEQAEELSDYEG